MIGWLFRRRRERADANAEYNRYLAFRDEMRRSGWMLWEFSPPPRQSVVQAHRFEWDGPTVLCPDDCPEWMNTANLYWRPAGPILDITPSRLLH